MLDFFFNKLREIILKQQTVPQAQGVPEDTEK